MAFSHGLGADFYFSGSDISSYLSDLDPSFERELAEIAHLGDSWKTNLAGLRAGSFAVSGDFDPTLDAAVWTAFDAAAATACIYYPTGTGTTPSYTFSAWVSSFNPGPAGTGDAVKYSFELTISGTVTRTA